MQPELRRLSARLDIRPLECSETSDSCLNILEFLSENAEIFYFLSGISKIVFDTLIK